MRRLAIFSLLTAAAMGESWESFRDRVRDVLSPPIPEAVTVDLLLDTSAGAVTPLIVRPSVVTLAGILAAHPGSQLRFWMLGNDAASTRILGQITFGRPTSQARSAREAHERREALRTLAVFDALQFAVPARSPLLTSVVRVAQETGVGQRVIVLASDLLENSPGLGDWTCRDPVPNATLRAQQLFLPGSLASVAVLAIHSGLRQSVRCEATTVHRELVVRRWTEAIDGAGGTFVAVTGELPQELFLRTVERGAR